MRIAFDTGAIAGFRGGGIEELVRNQFDNMVSLYPNVEFFPFDLYDEMVLSNGDDAGNVYYNSYYMGNNGFLRQYKAQWKNIIGDLIRNFLKSNQIDVFYITAPFLDTPDVGHNFLYEKSWFDGVTVVATLYDIIPYVMRDDYLLDRQQYEWYMSCVEVLRWVDKLIAISQSAKDDAVKYLDFSPDNIDVVYPGVSDRFRILEIPQKDKNALYNQFGITGNFIMCSASADRRKNIESAVSAYMLLPQSLQQNYQLVVVGRLPDEIKQSYCNKLKEQGLLKRVVFTGFVTDTQIVQLYNLAELMLFPSLYEGFGLPILEAWACGTAVAASNNSSLGEIVGEDGITFDPSNPKEIARVLEQALTTADLRALADKGHEKGKAFTWQQTAKKTMDSIVSAYNSRQENCEQKQDVGFVFFSGIGVSNSWMKTLKMLSEIANVTVFTDTEIPAHDENLVVVPTSKLSRKIHKKVFYVCPDRIGLKDLSLMKRIPGSWLILDEDMDRLISLIAKKEVNDTEQDYALYSKMQTYMLGDEQEFADESQIIATAISIITASVVKRNKLASGIEKMAFGIYPNEHVKYWDASMSDAAFANLCQAITYDVSTYNRVALFNKVCDTVAKELYNDVKLRKFSKMLGMVWGTESLMKRQERALSDSENKLKISMVTSWNSKCGIAEYTKYYLTEVEDRVDYTIFPNRVEALLGPEDENTAQRVWENHGSVDELANALNNSTNRIIHIQYTEGFFTSEGLCRLLDMISPDKVVFITCHNTKYLTAKTQKDKKLLSRAHYIPHQKVDENNLRALGIPFSNIHIIPLGQPTIRRRDAAIVGERLGISQHTPVIGSYGFLLPHKGIQKVIQAVATLREKYPDILYIACCSFFNADVSRDYHKACMKTIHDLKLEKNVRLVTDFLDPKESILLLQACDALLMVYDDTGESASGAVRFCVAAKRPLITTKQDIFREFEGCSLQIDNNTPEQIAQAVCEVMDETIARKYTAKMEEVIQKTSWETVGGEYIDIYKKYLDGE